MRSEAKLVIVGVDAATLRELVAEWRKRRPIDTDATHAARIGCAEQLEELLK